MDYQTLSLQAAGPIARMTLAVPGDGNRISLRTLRELSDACEAIDRAGHVSLLLLSAAGPDFCTGWADDAREQLSGSMGNLDPFACLAGLSVPVMAVLHGGVVSAGLELAMACDIRVAGESARFAMPEVSSGSVPLGGATARLPRIAGRTAASAMLLLGDELTSEDAYRCGLISRIIPDHELTKAAEELASRVGANGPIALRYAKEAIHNGSELPLDQALRYELDLSIILQTTRDRAEGVEAFLEKRPPDFEGR